MLLGVTAIADSAHAVGGPGTLAGFESEIRAAIAKVRPAVVKISAYQTQLDNRAPAQGGLPGTGAPYRTVGSGVIVDPRGYILTNAHVVGNFQDIRVRLWRANTTDVVGQVFDKNTDLDLALIRIAGGAQFPCAAIDRGGRARTGDFVVAIGNPFGLEHSVSMGVVSDRARTLVIDGRTYRDLLQTDAAINQGNSGGPLIDLQGEVIGINTAIYAPQGVFAGVGFAIPADRVLPYLAQLLPERRLGRVAASIEKEPIRPGDKAPHGPLGRCSSCHTFSAPPPRLAVTVAQTMSGSDASTWDPALPATPTTASEEERPVLKSVFTFAALIAALWVTARVFFKWNSWRHVKAPKC